MAVIKFKRGSGVPTGLTAFEAAWDTSAGRFFINNGSTAVWIGARIDSATDLGAAGSCAFFVPTQLAVKTYVDGQVAGGAVSSINGATGVVSILGGTGISVSTSLANKGITIGVNSNVALLDTAQTFTALKSFSAGLSASGGGITFGRDISVNGIDIGASPSVFNTNTRIGRSALRVNTGGEHNVAVGLFSLELNESGLYNVAVGSNALNANRTGGNNIAIGGDALAGNSAGGGNIAIGRSTMQVSSVGSSNIAIGSNALSGITNGNFNISIGEDTLRLVSGSNNIAFGYRSGSYFGNTTADLTSATNGLYLGFQARANANSQTNEIVIGTNALGFGSNTAVLGATTQSAAYIYGLVHAMSGVSAPGATFSGAVQFLSNITAPNLVTSVNGTTGAVVSVSSLNSATGAVSLFAGAGLSVASSTSIRGITFTNTGVLTNVAGSGISVSGATGNVTITNTGVLSFNGNIGAVQGVSAAVAGSGISVSGPTGSVTITNTGVLSNVAGSGINVSAGTGNVTITNAGVTGLVAGTGISVSSATGNVTVTNIGVQSIAGTANQITASGATGAVTLSLPSAVTMPGSLTVTGNLVVNGTTTTVNSTTVTVQDPLIAIGGLTGNIPPASGDVKDRGLLLQYNLAPGGVTGATAFFGLDQSTGYFTYIPTLTSLTNDVVSGNAGIAEFSGIFAPQGTLNLNGTNTSNATVAIAGAATPTTSSITNTAFETILTSGSGTGRLSLLDSTFKGTVVPTTLTAARTYTLPNHSGVVAAPTDLGTLNFVLTSQGSTAQPIWVNPATGLTANNANNILTVSDTSDAVCFVTFVNTGTNGMQSLKYNPGFTYNAVTNYLEVNIDGGAY